MTESTRWASSSGQIETRLLSPILSAGLHANRKEELVKPEKPLCPAYNLVLRYSRI
jgi:hypothetical protein